MAQAGPYLEAAIVAAISLAAALLARLLGQSRGRVWLICWLLPLGMVLIIVGLRRAPAWLAFEPPFRWMGAGRAPIALIGPAAAMLLVLPMPRLKRLGERRLLSLFLLIFVAYASVYPFVSPALVRKTLFHAATELDGDGVCLQSTPYTCGPAAAVTALARLGIRGSEGQLAILARTCPASGTTPDGLITAIDRLYAREGMACEYCPFNSVADLPADAPTLAVINLSFFIDHYVTVLEVTREEVVVGDPLSGTTRMPKAQFEKRWRHTGIVLRRNVNHDRALRGAHVRYGQEW